MRPRSPTALRPRAQAQVPLFGAGDALDRLPQDLVLERLLAEQRLQLADLVLSRPILRCRDDFLTGPRRRECACAINLRQVKSWFPAIP